MDNYAIYLRKSRADIEAEARGEGETLSRHRTALRALAERRGLNVVHEYAELVTGDSIAARPQMQALLSDVKCGLYTGVIVNDVDRLGRGDSIDQEIIKYTFIAGNCLIITPSRDINPASPSDEDMLEFSMFFSRYELRKISQRLSMGRMRSAAEGNFLSPRVPFGYQKIRDGKHITLEVYEDAAKVVKMVFEWYASRKYGYKAIADYLNQMGITTYRGYRFDRATIRSMLRNPIYIGRIVWGKTKTVSVIVDGKRVKKQIKDTPQVKENAHPAIISDELFNRVQAMFDESRHTYPAHTNATLANPLAGLLYCGQCGHAMQLRGRTKPNDKRVVTCINTSCSTRGTYVSVIVDAVLETLKGWCATYAEPVETKPEDDGQEQVIRDQIASIEFQIEKAHEYVEREIYTIDEYLRRKAVLQERLESAMGMLQKIEKPVRAAAMHDALPTIQTVIDAYPMAKTVEQQNELLSSVVKRIDYYKTEVATKAVNPASLVTLTVYPRLIGKK